MPIFVQSLSYYSISRKTVRASAVREAYTSCHRFVPTTSSDYWFKGPKLCCNSTQADHWYAHSMEVVRKGYSQDVSQNYLK